MDFSKALIGLKSGHYAYRKSWIDHFAYTVGWLELRPAPISSEVNQPYLLRRRGKYSNATGFVSSGYYNLTLEDILADDWEISQSEPSRLRVDDLMRGVDNDIRN